MPASGSDSANAPIASPVASCRSHAAFCGALRRHARRARRPASWCTTSDDRDRRARARDRLDRQRVADVVAARAAPLRRRPSTPSRPRAPQPRITSRGNSPLSSIAAARGATTSRANCSRRCWKACCSGVRSKFTTIRRVRGTSVSRPMNRSAYLRATAVVRVRQPLEDRPQPLRRLRQVLGQHARVADDGHEVRVAVPARHEVDVQVIERRRRRPASEVDADVDALRLVRLGQRHLGVAREPHQLGQLVGVVDASERCAGSAPPSDGRCCRDRG